MPRRSLWFPLGALFVYFAIFDAASGRGGADPIPATGAAPGAVNSGYVLFAHVDAKSIRDSALVTELKQGFAKAGGKDLWDKFEQESSEGIGLKPTEVDSVTTCVTEFPAEDRPKFIVIVTAVKAFNKTNVFGYKLPAAPDSRGLYPAAISYGISPPGSKGPNEHIESYIHFPDDKTAVLLHADLAKKYLEGYGKNRTGWPLTADLTKAAAGHVAFVTVNMDKLPAEARNEPAWKKFGPLMTARTITLAIDLKGKELSGAARATFAGAADAGKAKEMAQSFLGEATAEVGKILSGSLPPDFAPYATVIKEAHRALKAAKVEVVGSDVTAAGSFKADFDIERMTADAVKQIRETAPRYTTQNNLKQIGLSLHNYASTFNDQVPIHGIGPKGTLLKDAKEKPLLSWRVAMLPYFEQDTLYKQFKLDEPWDSDNNKKLIEKMPKIYAPVNKPGKAGYTHMQMVIGPNAMQPPFVSFPTSFPDGLSNTIAVVEAAEPVIWTKPDDVMFPDKELPKDFRKKFGGLFPDGFHVLMWDGSVRFVKNTVSDRTLGFALNPNDGQPLGSDW